MIDQLIEDTLYGRRLKGYDWSCLSTNEAGQELIRCTSNICDHLERALLRIDYSLKARSSNIRKFIGLEDVMGAYLINAARYNPSRAIQFIQTLSPLLIKEFISDIPLFFWKKNDSYVFGVSIPPEYIEFVERSIQSENNEIAATAQRALEKLSSK